MSSLRRLTSNDRPVVDTFLDCHRASSMFLRANLFHSGLEDGPEPFCGLYVGAFAGDALTDVAAHYWNGNIILQAPTQPVELALVVAGESGRPVDGLLGPWHQVEAAEPELARDRARLSKVVPEYLYLLDLAALAVPEALSSGRVNCRRAGDGDLTALVAWQRQYDLHALGYPDHGIDDVANRDRLAVKIENNHLWVLEEAGCLVSMTGFNAALPDAVQVGGAFTPVELRGRGHGRAVIAGSLLDARADGAGEAILFTEAENHPAQRIYESLGFERIGDYGMVLLDPIRAKDEG
ncbi:GNAT family N-acetyltransferase [Candidatus Rariloculus sp.]|uniref:GNAT family N-acetyltransferase n=1 Tax=Candidatus Rariloculus sp. TaxID=3101265 RepID=UPI003D14E47B